MAGSCAVAPSPGLWDGEPQGVFHTTSQREKRKRRAILMASVRCRSKLVTLPWPPLLAPQDLHPSLWVTVEEPEWQLGNLWRFLLQWHRLTVSLGSLPSHRSGFQLPASGHACDGRQRSLWRRSAPPPGRSACKAEKGVSCLTHRGQPHSEFCVPRLSFQGGQSVQAGLSSSVPPPPPASAVPMQVGWITTSPRGSLLPGGPRLPLHTCVAGFPG